MFSLLNCAQTRSFASRTQSCGLKGSEAAVWAPRNQQTVLLCGMDAFRCSPFIAKLRETQLLGTEWADLGTFAGSFREEKRIGCT